MKRDLYTEITDRIVAALEAGTKPWAPDWIARSGPALRVGGEQYRGINQLLLYLAAADGGYSAQHWMTYKQAQELDGQVRKGERSTMIVFFKTLEREEVDEATGEERTVGIPMLRSYNVFNVEQIDGLPERFAPKPVQIVAGKARDEAAEAAIRSCGADIREGGSRAFYQRSGDFVQLPGFELFHSVGGFLATMAHECVHWTGAPHRLDRTKGQTFGDRDYAFEELVAEIGAAFVMGRLGVAGDHFESHAAYIGSWIKALKDDKRMIFKASSLAQAAADLVLANAGSAPVQAPAPARPAPAFAPAAAQLSLAI
ncbi:MAG: zincin-like metallopeptidase domain-containing protein [Pseudomonadota bacterium]|nr:zincin-like metallopeptidase domain-containing protein [Pseudomonadota bacterium]